MGRFNTYVKIVSIKVKEVMTFLRLKKFFDEEYIVKSGVENSNTQNNRRWFGGGRRNVK